MSGYDYEKIVYQMLKKIRNPEHWKRIYTYIKVSCRETRGLILLFFL